MKAKLLLSLALLLGGFSAPVIGQLTNGDFSQGGANWGWFSADIKKDIFSPSCSDSMNQGNERVEGGVAWGHNNDWNFGAGFRETCGAIRQEILIPPGAQLKFDRKLGKIDGLSQSMTPPQEVTLRAHLVVAEDRHMIYSASGKNQPYNCSSTCPEFKNVTGDVSQFWGQNVTLEFFAISPYERNSSSMNVTRPSQAFIDNVEFEPIPPNPHAAPTAGLWFNPDRQGGGIDISRSSTGELLVVWYTYLPSGTPVWFTSDVEPMIDGTWVAALRKANRDPVSGNVVWQAVGTAELTMLANNELIFTWDLNAQSGSQSAGAERMFHLVGGDRFSGMVFEPAFPGWGVTVDVQGSGSSATNVATAYFYTSSGQPVWAQGVESGDLTQSVTFDMQTFTGLCPGCTGQPPSSAGTPAGTLNMREFSTSSSNPKGYSDIETAGGVTWTRGSPSNLITYARLTKP